LTTPSTSFVGRGEEIDALGRVVSSGVRLVTLVGPPGAGKTRLSVEFCRDRDRALFVDLTAARTELDVLRTLADALDVQVGGEDPMRQIGWALDDASWDVVVLDNCEQIVDVARRAVETWLGLSERPQFVVTSREALDLPAEIRISLGPLTADDALRLFEARARAVVPDFSIGESDRQTVTSLLEALDNLPLVIELAAARVTVLPPAQLLRRLSDRFAVVRDTSRATPRQASLEGAIDWSWEMLDAAQRRALARASVFRGGFSLEAAEALLDVDSPVDTLEALVEKSLIRRARSSRDPMDVRFRPYESVRSYAEKKLSDDERGALREQHARWYAEQASDWAAPLRDGDTARAQIDALERIGEEYANLWQALDSNPDEVRAEAGLALDAYLEARGPTSSRRDVFSRIGEVASEALRLRVTVARALAELAMGELARAAALIDELDGVDASGRQRAEFALARSRIARSQGEPEAARVFAEEAVDAAVEAGDRRMEALGRANVAVVAFSEPERARRELRRALELASRSEDARLRLQLRNLAGTLAMNRGDLVDARAHFERALPAAQSLSDHRVVAALRSNIALAEHYGDRLDEARSGFTAAHRAFRRVGLRHEAAIALGNRAAVEIDLGDYEAALETIQESLEAIGGTDTQAEAIVLATAGNLYHARGQLDRAVEHYGEALDRLAPNSPHVASTQVYRALAGLQAGDDSMGDVEPAGAHPAWSYAARALRTLQGGGAPGSPPTALPGQLGEGVEILDALVHGRPIDTEPRWLFARLVADWLDSEGKPDTPVTQADLIVDANGFWFRVDDEEIDIRRRGPARLILLAMAREPGRAFDLAELFEIGWPDQGNIDPDAADKRVYAAIGTLRKLGLSDLLVTTDQGYLLDPSLEVVLEGSQQLD
jgi:predicted ATPase